MKSEEVLKLKLGLYHIFWKSGGSSLAAVGMTENGSRWLAPKNWVAPTTKPDIWDDVLRVEMIKVEDHPDKNEPGTQMDWIERETSATAKFGPTSVLNVARNSTPRTGSLDIWYYTIMMFGVHLITSGMHREMRDAQVAAEQHLARLLEELNETQLDIHNEEG